MQIKKTNLILICNLMCKFLTSELFLMERNNQDNLVAKDVME